MWERSVFSQKNTHRPYTFAGSEAHSRLSKKKALQEKGFLIGL
jgi:hypothetical protein